MSELDTLLARLRPLFPDASPEMVRGSLARLSEALDAAECDRGCAGAESCPSLGYRPVISREFNGLRPEFVVRYARCERAARPAAPAGLPERLAACSFENFRTEGLPERVRLAKAAAMDCARNGGSLLLAGPPGTGKTHLAAAIAREAAARGGGTLFLPVVELIDRMKEGFYGAGCETEREARECRLLILDDLGAQRATDWSSERLFELADARWRENRPTIVTTNAESLGALAAACGRGGPMIVSRLADKSRTAAVSLSGCPDMRLRG